MNYVLFIFLIQKLIADKAMSQENKDYELQVLTMAINLHLDKTVAVAEDSLKSLEANRDHFVWEAATTIYTQSGYKVELSTVRDVLNSRIGAMKAQLEAARLEAAHQAAEEEAARLEAARRVAEKKAQLEAAQLEAARIEAVRLAEEKARLAEERTRLRAQMAPVFEKFAGDEDKAWLFLKVRKIVSEQLSVDEEGVNVNTHLSDDLGADGLDLQELVMALEEEFDIEISDEEANDQLEITFYYSGPTSFWSMSSGLAYSSYGGGGTNCNMKSFVDLICNKTVKSA